MLLAFAVIKVVLEFCSLIDYHHDANIANYGDFEVRWRVHGGINVYNINYVVVFVFVDPSCFLVERHSK
jgi:hypothetical protein